MQTEVEVTTDLREEMLLRKLTHGPHVVLKAYCRRKLNIDGLFGYIAAFMTKLQARGPLAVSRLCARRRTQVYGRAGTGNCGAVEGGVYGVVRGGWVEDRPASVRTEE